MNLLKTLPRVPVTAQSGSEVIQIFQKARTAVTATPAATETEVAIDFLEDAA
jgi:hypothetical protein